MSDFMRDADKANEGNATPAPLAVIPRPCWNTASTPDYRARAIGKRRKVKKYNSRQGDLLAPEIKGLF